MAKKILGISAYYHDSAACLVLGEQILAAAQEERFTRKKHDPGFPTNAIESCLAKGSLLLTDCDAIVFYDKPLLKFERLLETYLAFAPKGFLSFVQAMPVWLKEKLLLKSTLKKELSSLAHCKISDLPPLLFAEHHQSHAASAFYPSPYSEAAILCLDGVGEWATTSAWVGKGSKITPLWEINFPHSLGLLYSAFTYFTGFKVNSGEYKLMGLAPYGEPRYIDLILKNLIDLKEDGTFRLKMKYFNYATGLTMTNKRFSALFGRPPRKPETEITQSDMDIASSIQQVTEEIVLRLAKTLYKETNQENLCLAGGVALNCVANGRILREGPFKNIWIQPAAGDAGGALGAALAACYEHFGMERTFHEDDAMHGAYLGPRFENSDVQSYLDSIQAPYEYLEDPLLFKKIAELIKNENVIGWLQGRMEFGPRALGGRSIIGDARSEKMQSVMNLKIKYRESFRPFAPTVLAEEVSNYFDHKVSSPYMLLVAAVKEEHRIQPNEEQKKLTGIEKLKSKRSSLPAITHVDYSARIQTVHASTNPRYYQLISELNQQTGCPVVINTSFNVRGEPIVCTPEDAYRCFMRTEMDYLVLENFILSKKDQPKWEKDDSWKRDYVLD